MGWLDGKTQKNVAARIIDELACSAKSRGFSADSQVLAEVSQSQAAAPYSVAIGLVENRPRVFVHLSLIGSKSIYRKLIIVEQRLAGVIAKMSTPPVIRPGCQ